MGTAIIVVSILVLACAYPGFRMFLAVSLAGIAAIVTVFGVLVYVHQSQEDAKAAVVRQKEAVASAASAAEYERRVSEIYQSACAFGPDLDMRETCTKKAKQLCRDRSVDDTKECVNTLTQHCNNISTLTECGVAALEAKQIKHNEWCAELARQVPNLIAHARLLYPRSLHGGDPAGYTEYILSSRGILPANDCPNLSAAFQQYRWQQAYSR